MPSTVIRFIKTYLSVILIFFVFRLILFLTQTDRLSDTAGLKEVFLAFIMGVRFDIVVSGYILFIPFLAASVFSFFKKQHPAVNKVIRTLIFILFTLAFLVCAIDIPYFNQFFSRFSVSGFVWLDNPVFVFKMIIEEPRYWLAIIPFILVVFVFYRLLRRIFPGTPDTSSTPFFPKILISLIFLALILLGIRGRIEEKSPIRVGTAYFSNNAFLNQLGLNPNFTLLTSYLEGRKEENRAIHLINNEIAIANVQKYLNISNPDQGFPLLRKIEPAEINEARHNVVLVIMESMAAAKMERHGNQDGLTPFFDSISKKGYYFENAYTAGIHTFNGIFSSLFAFPALFRQHPMKGTPIIRYPGLFSTLKGHGYSTIYFATHDGQFDNVEGFLKANDCETVIAKPDYPASQIKTTLGVPDDFMFGYSIPVLNGLYKKNRPFAAVFMTASDHGPYYLPGHFKPRSREIKKQIVEYADYSLRKFMELSSAQEWYRNTLFVFVADHGAPLDATYEMSVDYHHTPLLFYAPEIIAEPATFSGMAGQIDIFPSIMGLLRLPYGNQTLGIDLFRESRPYIYFGADDKYGVIDGEWFLIVRNDQSKKLFRYRNKDIRDYAAERPEIVDGMKVYAESSLQAFQYLVLKKGSLRDK